MGFANLRRAFCHVCTRYFILFDFSGSRCRCLRRLVDNLPAAEYNQQPSAWRPDCNETGIYFLFPPAVAPVRHDWACAELFTAPVVEGQEKNNNKEKTSNNLWSMTSWDVVWRRRAWRRTASQHGDCEETLWKIHLLLGVWGSLLSHPVVFFRAVWGVQVLLSMVCRGRL